MIYEAVIVGAGSAGLSCAHTLQRAGADYVVVSEDLGGRLAYDPAQRVNFGAYFVMANYHHARRLVTRRTRIDPFSCRFHDGRGGSFPSVSGHTARRAPGFAAFGVIMANFIRHYESFKKNCEYMSQREAMELDPYIGKLFAQPAAQFIADHHLGRVSADYISKFSYACTGVDLESINALNFCNVSQGLVLPIHRFSFDAVAERAHLGTHLVDGTVTRHDQVGALHKVRLADGQTIQARNVVFATPPAVTATFLELGKIRDTCQLYVDHVRGRLRPGLTGEQMNLFPFTSPVIFTAVQDDGTYLVYTRVKEFDLGELFVEHELIGRREWDKAMYVSGDAYVEQQYGDSTYVAGDHNGLGLEPPAISGVYAARQILKKLPH
jgi:glycine/D-amino acid oxidase-like deaminating enzyme